MSWFSPSKTSPFSLCVAAAVLLASGAQAFAKTKRVGGEASVLPEDPFLLSSLVEKDVVDAVQDEQTGSCEGQHVKGSPTTREQEQQGRHVAPLLEQPGQMHQHQKVVEGAVVADTNDDRDILVLPSLSTSSREAPIISKEAEPTVVRLLKRIEKLHQNELSLSPAMAEALRELISYFEEGNGTEEEHPDKERHASRMFLPARWTVNESFLVDDDEVAEESITDVGDWTNTYSCPHVSRIPDFYGAQHFHKSSSTELAEGDGQVQGLREEPQVQGQNERKICATLSLLWSQLLIIETVLFRVSDGLLDHKITNIKRHMQEMNAIEDDASRTAFPSDGGISYYWNRFREASPSFLPPFPWGGSRNEQAVQYATSSPVLDQHALDGNSSAQHRQVIDTPRDQQDDVLSFAGVVNTTTNQEVEQEKKHEDYVLDHEVVLGRSHDFAVGEKEQECPSYLLLSPSLEVEREKLAAFEADREERRVVYEKTRLFAEQKMRRSLVDDKKLLTIINELLQKEATGMNMKLLPATSRSGTSAAGGAAAGGGPPTSSTGVAENDVVECSSSTESKILIDVFGGGHDGTSGGGTYSSHALCASATTNVWSSLSSWIPTALSPSPRAQQQILDVGRDENPVRTNKKMSGIKSSPAIPSYTGGRGGGGRTRRTVTRTSDDVHERIDEEEDDGLSTSKSTPSCTRRKSSLRFFYAEDGPVTQRVSEYRTALRSVTTVAALGARVVSQRASHATEHVSHTATDGFFCVSRVALAYLCSSSLSWGGAGQQEQICQDPTFYHQSVEVQHGEAVPAQQRQGVLRDEREQHAVVGVVSPGSMLAHQIGNVVLDSAHGLTSRTISHGHHCARWGIETAAIAAPVLVDFALVAAARSLDVVLAAANSGVDEDEDHHDIVKDDTCERD
ncbi:unnamed protein product [Amoebophrya sp. A25]|nr:unnamed protein product [Amoebophrya sp. A25]|eukprot:GSA25T00000180001.1